jgi:ABC-type nitrate/sulfonate/bicarbonate transport system permease component
MTSKLADTSIQVSHVAVPEEGRRSVKDIWARIQGPVLGALGAVMLLASWEIAADLGWVNVEFTSKPSLIYQAAGPYFSTGTAWNDIQVSATEFGYGFLLSLLVGLVVGLIVGWWRWIDQLTEPIITFSYAAPRIALVPLLVIWFGIGIGSKVAVVFLSGVFPIILSTRSGVKTTDVSLLRVARSVGASQLQIFRTVVLPGAVPSIVTGIRLAIATGLIGVVVGELIASSAGLGYTILYAGNTFNASLVFVALFIIAGAGVVLTSLVRAVERHFDRWRPDYRG